MISKLGQLIVATFIGFGVFTDGMSAEAELQPVPDAPWRELDTPVTAPVSNLRFLNGVYFAVGGKGLIMKSSDLSQWKVLETGVSVWINDIAFSGDQYVAVGEAGTVLLSEDLETWTPMTPAGKDDLSEVTWGAGRFVAVGRGRSILSTTDGSSWQQVQSHPDQMTSWLTGVTFGKGNFVAVGDTTANSEGAYLDTIVRSELGTDWSLPRTPTSDWLNDVTYSNDQFVAVGDAGKIYTSPDGDTWLSQISGTSQDLNAVAYGDGRYIAVGWFGAVAVSTDAKTWTSEAIEGEPLLQGIAFGPHGFVAVGRSGTIYTRKRFDDIAAKSLPSAGSDKSPPKQPIRVVIREQAPFCFERNGKLEGYGVELWNAIADECNFEGHLTSVDSSEAAFEALVNGSADVATGGLSPTLDRSLVFDFSYPDQMVGFQTLVRSNQEAEGALVRTLQAVFSKNMLMVFGAGFVLSLVISVLIFAAERKVNSEIFHSSYRKGFFHNFFWSIQTLIAHNCGGKTPKSVAGFIVTILWMLYGCIFTAQITAILTTNLTVAALHDTPISDPADLKSREVATVADSDAQRWLNDHLISATPFDQIDQAVDALVSRKVDAVVFDSLPIQYYLLQNPRLDLKLTGPLFGLHPHAYIFPANSKFQLPINRALKSLSGSGFLDELNYKWFGSHFWENDRVKSPN